MAGLSPSVLGIALTVLVLANSVASQDKCRSGCHGVTPNTFKFAEGTTYKYNLDGNVDIQLSSAESQLSNTKLKATVLLTQLPQCNQILRLQNVQIFGADGKKYSNIPNIEKPVRLNFHDGHVEDLICAEKGDTQVSLNIKRAVASLFQANIKKQFETDVFGVCPTDVTTKKEGNIFTVSKHKNLNKCSHRENLKDGFMKSAFNLNSEIKTSPVLSSDYHSEQKIKAGILDHVTVTENYLFVPFSVGKHGAKATVTTKLQFQGKSTEQPKATCSEPKTIIFDNPHPVTTDKSNVNTLVSALKDATATITDVVGESTPKHFIDVVKIMRASKKDDLLTAYNQAKSGAGFKDKNTAQKFFIDALVKTGTGESVEVAIELLKNNEISCPMIKRYIFLGLAFVSHATPGSITGALSLLDGKDVPREAYLGVGALVSQYCKQHTNCATEDAVKKVTQKFLSKLGDGKCSNRNQENEMVYVLKGIKNMQVAEDSVVGKVVAIANNKNAPTRLRVAALEAYQADPCKDKFRDSAINILKDIQQDSEIRIKAYLAATECPNGKVANAIKKLLDDEPSIQVKGYIVSHLRNLKSSTNPDKELAKQQLGSIKTNQADFPIDFRRFSQNFEFSHAMDTMGVGATTEADLIYSQNSFLPRSTSLNLTTELFGHRFNFLEIDTRQENLDKLMEHYFGPLGVLRGSDAKEKVRESLEKYKAQIGERLGKLASGGGNRRRRDVSKAEIESIGKQVQIKTSELNKDLDLDLSIKVMGSEVAFLSLTENSEELSKTAMIDKLFDYVDQGLHKAQNFDQTFQHNNLLLELELAYPTSLGFPLKIDVDAAASVQVQAKGHIDVVAVLSEADGTVAKMTMIPSGTVEVSGRLVLDAYFVENGLKIASTIHSSTGGAAELEIFDDKQLGYDFKYSLPLQKQQLISANHEIVKNSRELGHPEVDTPLKFPQSKDFEVCADQVAPFIGLIFCAQINRPNQQAAEVALPFPLDGHSKFGISILKDDLKMYHVREAKEKGDNVEKYSSLYEVVGEKDTKLKLEGVLSIEPEYFFNLDFLAKDLIHGNVQGKLVDTVKEKYVYLGYKLKDDEAFAKIGFTISESGKRYVMVPIFDYKYPHMQGKPYQVTGQIILTKEQSARYTFENFKVITPEGKNFVVKGFVGYGAGFVESDISLGDGKDSGSLKSKVIWENGLDLHAQLQNSFNPDVNMKIDYKLLSSDSTPYDSNLVLVHGKDLNSKTNVIRLVNSLSGEFNKTDPPSFQVKNEFSYPLRQIEAKANYGQTDKSVNYLVDVKHQDVKFGSELDFKYNQKAEDDYDLKFLLHGIKNKIDLKAKRVIKGDKSDLTNILDFNGKKVELKGTITHIDNDDVTNYSGDLVMKVPGQNDAYKVSYGLVLKEVALDTFLKVQKGGTVIVDNVLKVNEKFDANGQIKMTFAGVFTADGQLKAVKGKGDGHILAHFVKVDRKMKAEVTYTIQDPTYNVDLTVYTDFEKDNKKKYVIVSHNKVNEDGLDSQNSYEYQGQKFETNLKASFDDDFMNGKQKIEADILFPNELYLSGKVHREMQTSEEEVINGNIFINLEQRKNKNTPGLKFTFKGAAKNTDLAEDLYDVTGSVALDNSQGKNLNGDFSLLRKSTGEDKWLVDMKTKLFGSVMPNTYESHITSEYTEEVGNYNINAKYGPKNSLVVKGKYDLDGEDSPFSGEVDVELHTSSPQFSVLKFHSAGTLGIGLKENVYFEATEKTSIFVDDDGTDPAVKLDLKYDGSIVVGEKDADLKSTIKFQNEDPITVALNYKFDANEQKKTFNLHGTSAITYAKDKTFKLDLSYEEPNENEFNIDAKVLTPNDKAKNTRVQWHVKALEKEQKVDSDFKITADGKVYELLTDVDGNEVSPSLSLKLKHPDGKSDEVYVKVKKATNKAFIGDLKIVSAAKNFALTSSIDAQVESVDDFAIKINIDCPAMKFDKVVVEALNKGGKGGKKIQFTAKSGDKNLLSGSTNYKTREEAGKFIIEGSGSFKVKEESKTANFKYSRQDLTMDKNGEEGVDMSFDASIGTNAVDSELKVTNKHFRFSNSYCEEKKECAHVEVDSKVAVADANQFKHVLEVNVDLRKLGLSHEFGLKAVTEAKGYVLDHTVDVHFQNQANSKYQYSLYTHPNKAGVSLTTPKRIVSIEGALTTPKKGAKNSEGLEGHVAIYMDKKNKPNEKTILSGYANTDETKRQTTMGVKFTTPGLGKDLVVELTSKKDEAGKVYEFTEVIDIFAKPNQKITVNGKSTLSGNTLEGIITVKSPGLNIDIKAVEKMSLNTEEKSFKYYYNVDYSFDKTKWTTQAKLEASPTDLIVYGKLFDKPVIDMHTKSQISKENMVLDTDMKLFESKPCHCHIELKNGNTLTVSMSKKDTPNDKLVIHAGLVPGQIADARAEIFKGGKKIDLVHGSIKLDDANFLKSDYGIKVDDIKTNVLLPAKENMAATAEQQKQLVNTFADKAATHLNNVAEVYKKNSPNLQPAKEYYVSELNKVKSELISDKTLSEVTEFLREVFGASAQAVSEIFSKLIDFTEKVFHAFQNSFVKVTEAIKTELLPKFQALQDQVGGLIMEVFEVTTDTFFTFLAKISQFIDAHQSEIKGLTSSMSSVLSDVTRALFKAIEEAKVAVTQELHNLTEEIKALPLFEQAKQYYEHITQELDVRDIVLNFLSEGNQIQDYVDAPEMKEFIKELIEYLTHKVKQETVDDRKVIESLVKHLVKFFNQLVVSVDLKQPGTTVPKQNIINLDYLAKLPRLVGAQSSLLNRLFVDDDYEPEQFLYNVAFNPYLWIPPFKLHAILVQGQHIFTFDGKHLTFPGSCNYLLARDAVNGNFTIAGTYTNGFLTALTVADKHDSITVKSTGQCLLGTAPSEYPVRKPTIEARKTYDGVIIDSKAGVRVICNNDLTGCGFIISGFYHGQLKGLLGNGNSEPYDDFTLPNGKIVTGEAEFGNAYKMQNNCPAVKTMDHKHDTHNKQCTKYFADEDSDLSLCFEFVPSKIFRQACDHGMGTNNKDSLKLIVTAYAAACNSRGIPVEVPDEFVKCTNGDKVKDLDDTFTTKVPNKAADVVIVFDEAKANEVIFKELIQNLINDMNKEFNAKKVNDIEYHFIGYGGEFNKRPYHYTVAGKFTSKGKLPVVKFSVPPVNKGKDGKEVPLSNGEQLVHELMTVFGLSTQPKAYQEAISYPFRANALKTVVAVVGKPCETNKVIPNDLFQLLIKLRSLFIDEDTIKINLVTPFQEKGFTCKDAKTTPTVVGFNSEKVFTYADFKKKTEGSSDLREHVKYEDYCVDYTLENDGNVFVSNNFLSAKGPQRKQFATVAAHNIVAQLTSKPQTLSCECERVNFYSAKNTCTEE